jgi:hypothetical protein
MSHKITARITQLTNEAEQIIKDGTEEAVKVMKDGVAKSEKACAELTNEAETLTKKLADIKFTPGGFELNKANAGLEGNRKALALAEKSLEKLKDEEAEIEKILEQTAGSKRDTIIESEKATLEGAKQTREMMIAKAEAMVTQANQTYEKAELKFERVKKEAEATYETKSAKCYQKLRAKREELEERVAGYIIAVETSEDRVTKLSSTAQKRAIKKAVGQIKTLGSK